MFNWHDDSPGYGNNPNIFGGFIYNTKYGDVPAYCIDTTRNFINEKLKNIQNGIFVEIGVFGGSTLLSAYDICKNNNIKIYGIDPWEKIVIFNGVDKIDNDFCQKQEIDRYKNIRENLKNIINNNNLNNIIELIHEESWKIYNYFDDNSIDIIHIDGDHSYNGVKKDLELYWNKIKSNGIIIADDYHMPCINKAVEEFISNNKNMIYNEYLIQNGEKKVFQKK